MAISDPDGYGRSGKCHNYFAKAALDELGERGGVRANLKFEMVFDTSEVLQHAWLFETASEGILCREEVPGSCILFIRDASKNVIVWTRPKPEAEEEEEITIDAPLTLPGGISAKTAGGGRGQLLASELSDVSWGGFDASVLTFAQQIVAGDSWGRVTIPIMEEYPWTAPYFIMVFVTIDLGLLNLILSVIVDKAHQAHQEDVKFQMAKRQKEFDNSKKRLTELCQILDEDMSGALSLDELLRGYDHLPEFKEQMRRMDVEREDMLSLFKCLDADQSGDIMYAEFVEQVVKMRSQDVTLSLVFLRSQIKEIKQATNAMTLELEELKRKWSPNSDAHLPQYGRWTAVPKTSPWITQLILRKIG
ncbi:hypothetical protein AK812_SmicGene29194 [Symbiodinium microadriaticum]|uniref:EF-hand domain-containing protein n=1 Tax=Symbiodinium microadriaticum TaxID=2951 RepID=A0A1Q9D2J2_SYMMI|nr:hypothetical protein AK812_SmicGene29194 [Symbiodinium microadriaticum]